MPGSAESYAAHQRARFMQADAARWMRPDASRWIRPDIARFLVPSSDFAFPDLDRKYNPNQPRVPGGNPDGGQWSGGGGRGRRIPPPAAGARIDPRIVSDATPESLVTGQQYAQARGGRGGGSVLINGQQFELSPGQGARLEAAQARAESAIARIREIDPGWKPPTSAYQSPEGLIRAYEADAEAAKSRAGELASRGALPGPYSGESIPARGPSRNFTASERREINGIGSETGCHTCGTTDPGTPLGNFVPDHQIPSNINPIGRAQRLYPQCLSCSLKQGPFVRDIGKWGR